MTVLKTCSRLLPFFALLLLLPALALAEDARSYQTGAPGAPEILWDTWGVPHIFAQENAGLFYGFGWAQAHLHGDLLLGAYAESRGRAAEYFGAEPIRDDIGVTLVADDLVAHDILVRTLNIPADGQIAYDAQSDEFRQYMDAFAQGINDYAAANPDALDPRVLAVLPVSGVDVITHAVRVHRIGFVGRRGIGVARAWAAEGEASAGQTALNNLALIDSVEMGSNAWAVGPERSASGNAMLVINPHQPWYGIGMWVEAHLVAPGVNIYGATLIGNPVIGVGFNDALGWAHTVNRYDGFDLYELTLTDDGGYLLDGETRDFEMREEVVLVKGEDDTLIQQPITIRRSAHGAVLAERSGSALAIRIAGDELYGSVEQWWDMGRAASLEEFETIMRRQQVPLFTVMYADRDGNIMHLFNGHVPVRETGDWDYWYDIVPGDDSALIWTELHAYDDLPKVINPETGWLQNANEPPWTTTFPLAIDAADYPPYMSAPPEMGFRPISSATLLYNDESITYDELVTYKHSTRAELAARIVDDLIAAAEASGNDAALRAAEVLAGWDFNTDADSVGAALFALWLFQYTDRAGDNFFAVPFDLEAGPFSTPDGLGDPELAASILASTVGQLSFFGGPTLAWGDAARLRVGEYDLPANGGFGAMGVFRTVEFLQGSDGRFEAFAGDSFYAIIEFGETPRAGVLLSHGNSSQPGSPHFGDQLTLFMQKQLRDAWMTRADIEANLDYVESFE